MTLSYDDSRQGILAPGGGFSNTVFLPTTFRVINPESVVLLAIQIGALTTFRTVASVVGPNSLIWTRRAASQGGPNGPDFHYTRTEYWWAPAASTFGFDDCTITLDGAAESGISYVMVFSGLNNYLSPFDLDPSLPYLRNNYSSTSVRMSVRVPNTLVGQYNVESQGQDFGNGYDWATWGDALIGNDFQEILFIAISGDEYGEVAEFSPQTSPIIGTIGTNVYWENLSALLSQPGYDSVTRPFPDHQHIGAGISFSRPHPQRPFLWIAMGDDD